jgi:hypothetical protein
MRRLIAASGAMFLCSICRLAQLLIERAVSADGGLEFILRNQSWQELAGELLPGTIGSELQEWISQQLLCQRCILESECRHRHPRHIRRPAQQVFLCRGQPQRDSSPSVAGGF